MSGIYDVFDSWGNKVGEFTPTGGGGFCGTIFLAILGLIAILFCNLMEGAFRQRTGDAFSRICATTKIEVDGTIVNIYSSKDYPYPYNLVLLINGQKIDQLVNMQVSDGHDQYDFGSRIKEVKIVFAWRYNSNPHDVYCNDLQVFP